MGAPFGGSAECKHFWKSVGGICLDCGTPVEQELPHQHRFPHVKIGDTALTCIDCKQVIFIKPIVEVKPKRKKLDRPGKFAPKRSREEIWQKGTAGW